MSIPSLARSPVAPVLLRRSEPYNSLLLGLYLSQVNSLTAKSTKLNFAVVVTTLSELLSVSVSTLRWVTNIVKMACDLDDEAFISVLLVTRSMDPILRRLTK